MKTKEFDYMTLGPFLLQKDTDAAKFGREVYHARGTINGSGDDLAVVILNKGQEGKYWYDEDTIFTVYPLSNTYSELDKKWYYGYQPNIKGSELLKHLIELEERYEFWLSNSPV
jgi:hypothetical protein